MRVAFQGEVGSYSEQAALDRFEACEPQPWPTFAEAYRAAASGAAEVALLPVENSLAGPIAEVCDLMWGGPLTVVAAHSFQVTHCLLGARGSTLEAVREVRSHPQ